MLIFLRHRLAFLATPKTGTTAVEMALRPRAGWAASARGGAIDMCRLHTRGCGCDGGPAASSSSSSAAVKLMNSLIARVPGSAPRRLAPLRALRRTHVTLPLDLREPGGMSGT